MKGNQGLYKLLITVCRNLKKSINEKNCASGWTWFDLLGGQGRLKGGVEGELNGVDLPEGGGDPYCLTG